MSHGVNPEPIMTLDEHKTDSYGKKRNTVLELSPVQKMSPLHRWSSRGMPANSVAQEHEEIYPALLYGFHGRFGRLFTS